jgi:outer membrane protein TolC
MMAGCASYRPQPLADEPSVLAAPELDLLSRDAAAIDRPFLAPVAIDFAQPLDGDAIAILAVLANPDLRALRARAGIADAQAFAAGLLPDPTFSFGVDQVLSGPDNVLGLASSLGFNLNALRTRRVAREQSEAAARQVRLDLAWSEWQTSGQARLQAARIVALQRQVGIDEASRAAAQTGLDRMLRAAGRGDMAGDAVQGARIAMADADERLRTDEQQLAAARGTLHQLVGFPPDRTIRLAEMLLPAPPPDPAALFALARHERLDLQALEAGYAAQEAAVHKAVLDQFPTLDLSINPARDTAGNVTIGPSVSFTLPLWNRNRGGIAIEQATRAALRAEYDSRLFQARAEIAAAVDSLRLLWRQRQAALATLPALERFAAASRRAASRGDLAEATAVVAEQTLRDRRSQLVQAERDIAEQTIALELLTGVPREVWTT